MNIPIDEQLSGEQAKKTPYIKENHGEVNLKKNITGKRRTDKFSKR